MFARANETSVTDLLEPTSLDTTVPEPLKFSVSLPTRLPIVKSPLFTVVVPL